MRKSLNVRVGSKLEIGIVDGNKFLLSKYSDMVSLKEYSDAVANAISVSIDHDVLISDMDNILSRSYFTQEQLNRLKEYAQEETLILYNGVYYKFRIDASAVLTNQTGNVAWGTTGAIGTTIYNASLQPDVGVLTLRPTGKINIITEDTEVYVHLIESDLGLGIKKLKTTI